MERRILHSQPMVNKVYRVTKVKEGLPVDLFAYGEACWLGVQPQGRSEQPRVMLVSVPYALKAVDAETLGGKPASAYALATPQTGGSESEKANAAISASNPNQSSIEASISGSGTKNFISRWTSSTALGNSNIFENTASKEIGIGTTTPSATLDVNGTTLLSGGSASTFGLTVSSPTQLGEKIQGPFTGVGAGLDFFTTGSGGLEWEILDTGAASSQGANKLNVRNVNTSTDVLTITDASQVGIGTTNPGAKLEVDGSNQADVFVKAPESGVGAGLDFFTTGSGGLQWEILDTGAASSQGANKLNVRDVTNGLDVVTIVPSGVGIQTTSPDNTLTVNGSADKPGGGSWGTFSDGRLKTLNGSFTSGLSQVLKLHPIRYRYKRDNAMGIRDADEHIGVVAQDVQRIIPEAVTENSKGYLLVNNDPIIWSMLNAIKEQQEEFRQEHAELAKALRQIKEQQSLLRAQSSAMRSLEVEVREARETLRKVKAQVAPVQPTLVATK
jgi:hypothetical protein